MNTVADFIDCTAVVRAVEAAGQTMYALDLHPGDWPGVYRRLPPEALWACVHCQGPGLDVAATVVVTTHCPRGQRAEKVGPREAGRLAALWLRFRRRRDVEVCQAWQSLLTTTPQPPANASAAADANPAAGAEQPQGTSASARTRE